MKRTKVLLVTAVVGGALWLGAGPALAGHEHFVVRTDRSGETHCQYVAHGQTRIDDESHGGYHRFHENVHLGQPGSDERGTDVDKDTEEEERCNHVYRPGSRRP